MKLRRNLHLLWLFTTTTIQNEAQYRVGVITWVINSTITPLLMMGVWLVVGSRNSLALSQSQIVTYYLLVIVVERVTQSWSIYMLGKKIRDGSLTFRLFKPYHYLIEEFGHTFGLKLYRVVAVTLLTLFLASLFSSSVQISWTPIKGILFFFALILGFLIRMAIENTIVLFVFWVGEYESLDYLHNLIIDLLSGALLPLALAPLFIKNLITLLPFRYYISFPIEMVLGNTSFVDQLQGFTVGIIYLIIFIFIYQWLSKKGIRGYSGFGQ